MRRMPACDWLVMAMAVAIRKFDTIARGAAAEKVNDSITAVIMCNVPGSPGENHEGGLCQSPFTPPNMGDCDTHSGCP